MAHPGVALIPDPEATVDALRAAGARFAFVHESRASGAARPGSDVDVAAWFAGRNPAPWSVAGLPSSIDLLVPDEAPLELAGRIFFAGVRAREEARRRRDRVLRPGLITDSSPSPSQRPPPGSIR